jgi:hypothetical protein
MEKLISTSTHIKKVLKKLEKKKELEKQTELEKQAQEYLDRWAKQDPSCTQPDISSVIAVLKQQQS